MLLGAVVGKKDTTLILYLRQPGNTVTLKGLLVTQSQNLNTDLVNSVQKLSPKFWKNDILKK